MNEILQQLATLGPGIAAGVRGNGAAMKAFMEGYQQTLAQLEEKKRLQQQDTLQSEDRARMLEDRERGITRQGEADTRAADDRARHLAMERVQIAPMLAEAGSVADSPEGAESSIDQLFQMLAPTFGGAEALAPVRDQAIGMAGRTITGRQKKQVEAYVDAALKTSFVADNPDSDPELIQLPEHIVKIIGKPAAKLSELQTFAQLPVGKPAGKTRVPAAVGSFEDYVERKYGPNPTPEQITEARKVYNQSDDRAPRVTVNTGPGGLPASTGNAALKFQDDYARDSKPYITLRDAYQRVKSAKPDAAGDLSLIFAYMKILDPNSVVREQEFANAQNAAGVPDRVRNLYNQTMEGVRLNPEQRKQFLSQAEALFENAKTNQKQVRGTYSNRAKQWGIPESMILDDDPMLADAPKPAPAGAKKAAAVGERRTIQGQLAEWDGKGWKPVQQ